MTLFNEMKLRATREPTRIERGRDLAHRAQERMRGGAERASDAADRAAKAAKRGDRVSRAKMAATGAGGAGAAAASAYFLDPQSGTRRRHIARDRIAKWGRKGLATARRETDHRAGQVVGAAKEAASDAGPETPAPNDQALADRVKSELLRPADGPKGKVSVNAENGIVYLRGEADGAEEVEKLVKITRSVDGVKEVESLLHPEGTAAPSERDGGRIARALGRSG